MRLRQFAAGDSCNDDGRGFDQHSWIRSSDSLSELGHLGRSGVSCGKGVCDPFRLALAPWFAAVARRNGVCFDKNQMTVHHDGWKLEQNASQDEVKQALENAAMFQSSLQQVAYRVNAFDILMAGTRRTMCAAFLVRSFFGFFIQLPSVVIPNLGVDAQMIHGLGSMEWDSDTEAESGPDEP